jgi:alpha-glucan,water dikinase
VLDRIGRALSRAIDSTYQQLQPKAELLGRGFKADEWTVELFSEEVVRGTSLGFVLSMLLRHLEPLLRKTAHLGNWQIISRGQGRGVVQLVGSLRAVQGKTYQRPTLIIADSVSGDEEIPPGITAVIAPDVTDIVSHVAVRARNANLLFASCHDPEVLKQLKALQGRQLLVQVSAAGDVVFQESTDEAAGLPIRNRASSPVHLARPVFTAYALAWQDFDDRRVGKKAFNQFRLREKLPDWVHQPKSVALPFAVAEKVLADQVNQSVAEESARLIRQITAVGRSGPNEIDPLLLKMRESLLRLSAPAELVEDLRQAMQDVGLAWPSDWEKMWMRIKQVWASKWNSRAYWSRQAMGLPHEDLCMAVLIQEVVNAEYAFVIHTTNPVSGQPGELLAELVLGLGETLVGNYPGRALSFIFQKKDRQATVLSYPSKSLALYGSGLIFRSDSNGEDLADFAGAGLYDSVLLDPPGEVLLDYTQERLIWEQDFRNKLLDSIAEIGLHVERAFGSPQDIEGAFAQGQFYLLQSRPQIEHG